MMLVMKKCKVCSKQFDEDAVGPWCHTCVGYILAFLHMQNTVVAELVKQTEEIREECRVAVREGRGPETTSIPGPYWGLNLR